MTGSLDIDGAYALAPDAPAFYRENGFVKLPEVLSADALRHFGPELTARVEELNTLHMPMEERTTYEKAFLQVMNLWTKSETVRQFVFGRRLARIAAELMGTRGVRLYHDQALYKEAGGGLTPWHADQYYWPMATDRCCTAWVPLQDTPFEMGPLAFAPGSHRFEHGRDLEISDESEAAVGAALAAQGFGQFEEPFRLGEVSFHSGWTFHRAGAEPHRSLPRGHDRHLHGRGHAPLRSPQQEPGGGPGDVVPRGGGGGADRDPAQPRSLRGRLFQERPSMKIVDAKVIVCSPGRNFVTLKLTTEDGVHGLGDATLNGRELAVASYLERPRGPAPHRPRRAADRGHLAVPLQGRLLAARARDHDRDRGGRLALWDILGKALERAGLRAARRAPRART